MTPGRLTAFVLLPAPREIAYSPLPKTPPGPALIRTISPPNEDRGVSSATEVIGAEVRIGVVLVFVVTVTVPRNALVGVGAAVKLACRGKTGTNGASKLRSSSGIGASSFRSRRRRCAGPRARDRDG